MPERLLQKQKNNMTQNAPFKTEHLYIPISFKVHQKKQTQEIKQDFARTNQLSVYVNFALQQKQHTQLDLNTNNSKHAKTQSTHITHRLRQNAHHRHHHSK